MSVYKFEAEPRVVRSKPKFRDTENEPQRPKAPLEMAEESIKAEMERRKFELRKEQLIIFKKDQIKKTPYNLRPASPPKIEVDLAYFLTEQNVQTAVFDAQNTQTDEWAQGPAEPFYLPQKKGVDVETQIWDEDLFNYDIEVEPILHVLVSKTLEQARLEVDEAAELEAIKQYKEEYAERRKLEKEDWENQVKEELNRLTNKNELLARERERRARQDTVVKKLQCIHLAKEYLKGMLHNSLESVIASNYWQDNQYEAIHSMFIPAITKKVQTERERKIEIKVAVHSIAVHALIEPTRLGQPLKEARIEKLRTKEIPRKIQNPRYRNVRIMFSNIVKPKSSKLGFYIRKSLNGKLDEWEKEAKESYSKYKERYFQGEENIEELISQYNEQLLPPSMDFLIDINSIPSLSFAIASEPYDYLAEHYKRYWPEIYLYNLEGAYSGKFSLRSNEEKYGDFLKGTVVERDKILKENDDSKISIALKKIHKDIGSLLLVVKEDAIHKNAKENWYGNARFRLLDEDTYQSLEYEKLAPALEKALKVESTNQDDIPESRIVICGRIYSESGKWKYEAYNTGLLGKKVDLEERILSLETLAKREDMPTINITEWEEEYAQQKAQATKTKGKGKKEDPKAGKSHSKIEDKKNKSKIKKEEEPEEKKIEEETLQDKLFGYTDFPIGPISIDCEEDVSKIESDITDALKKANPGLLEKCENGVEIFVKDKQLKSTRQILHHSHILKQMIVRPKVPQLIPQAEIQVEESAVKDEEAQD